jgi:hypothetical protein
MTKRQLTGSTPAVSVAAKPQTRSVIGYAIGRGPAAQPVTKRSRIEIESPRPGHVRGLMDVQRMYKGCTRHGPASVRTRFEFDLAPEQGFEP